MRCDGCRFWIAKHPLTAQANEGLCGKLSDDMYSDTQAERIRFVRFEGRAAITRDDFFCAEFTERPKK